MNLRSQRWLVLILFALGSYSANAQTTGSVTGLVRDGSGLPLPDVGLVLSAKGAPVESLHTTTDQLGAFHFDHLIFGSYTVSSSAGDTVAPSGPVTLSAAMPVAHLELMLTKAPRLQLQAAGIRGYIDQGGYSAPAGAAAASNLIQGAADLNRNSGSADDTAAACAREPALLKASQEHPEDAVAQRQLGQLYLLRHQPEKAVASLQRARELDKSDTQTLFLLAEALVQSRQFAAARDLLATDASSAKTAAGHRLLARSDEGLGQFRQASMEYQSAAALEPTEADSYGAGYELILAGSAKAAVQVFEAGTARYPGSVTLLMGIGTGQYLQGESAEATRTFLRCASLHPGDARLYPFLSASFAVSKTDAKAVEAAFRRYYELSPKSAEAAYFYALILLHPSAAGTTATNVNPETLLRLAVQEEPAFAKAHLQLGSVFFDRRDYAHAIEEFSTALRLDPSLWETHYKLSAAYRRTRETALADQQMQLFEAKKSQTTADEKTSGVPIEQYLSVFAGSSGKSAAEIPCTTQP